MKTRTALRVAALASLVTTLYTMGAPFVGR
jgi:hypothetical protein